MSINKKLLIVDYEATCDNRKTIVSEIIEIGVVEICLETKQITRKRQFLIKPTIATELSPFCKKLTGHDYGNLMKHGYTSSEAYRLIAKHFGSQNKPYAGWGCDNIGLLQQAKRMKHRFTFNRNYVDLAYLYGLKNELESHSLSNALDREGIIFDGTPHSGIDDAYNTAKLFLKCFL